MPSLRDVAHTVWLCTFPIQQRLDIPSARSWAAPASNLLLQQFIRENTVPNTIQITSFISASNQGNRYGTEKAGGAARPSRSKTHLPGNSSPVGKTGRRFGPAL